MVDVQKVCVNKWIYFKNNYNFFSPFLTGLEYSLLTKYKNYCDWKLKNYVIDQNVNILCFSVSFLEGFVRKTFYYFKQYYFDTVFLQFCLSTTPHFCVQVWNFTFVTLFCWQNCSTAQSDSNRCDTRMTILTQ